jgi:glycyl-tRNA synthetase beta chain
MGIVSVLLEKGYTVSLRELFAHALGTLGNVGSHDTVMDDIMNFMAQRTEFILSSAGHNTEIIKSVLHLSFSRPLKTITARIGTLTEARKEESFPEFLLAIKRVNNIVPKTALPPVQPGLFQQDEERDLHAALASARETLTQALEGGDFSAAMKAILPMTPAINRFFDKVLVMDKREEIKTNRLSLLRDIWEAVAPIADFSKFQS